MPARLRALARGDDVLPVGQMDVDDLPLDGRHRLERDRPVALQRVRGRAVGQALERAPAPVAVPGRVDNDLLPLFAAARIA